MVSSKSTSGFFSIYQDYISSIQSESSDSKVVFPAKFESHLDAALKIIMQAQENHPHFQASGFKAHQLIPLSSIELLPGEPKKEIASNPILMSLSTEQIAHLKKLMDCYPCGVELNLLHFLGMVILDSCKDPAFAEAFTQEFVKFSLMCFAKQSLSKKWKLGTIEELLQYQPQIYTDHRKLLTLNLREIVKERGNPEKKDLCDTLSILNRILPLKHNNLLAADPLKDYFFCRSPSKKLEDFVKNLDLAKKFLDSTLSQPGIFLLDNKRGYKQLQTYVEKLRELCSESSKKPSCIYDIIYVLSLLSECSEELLITAHHSRHAIHPSLLKQALHDHVLVSAILNIVGPLLPVIESLNPGLPFITLLERIERLIHVQEINLDPSYTSTEDQFLKDGWKHLSVFDEKKIKELFQPQLKSIHDPDLLSLIPSCISKIAIARKLFSCIKEARVYSQQSSRVAQKLDPALRDATADESIAQQTYFGLLGSLLKLYLLRDIHRLHTGEDRPLADYIPPDLRKLLDLSTKVNDQFYTQYLPILASCNIMATPILSDAEDWTALIQAAQEGDLEQIKLAIENRANINFINKLDWTALSKAAAFGRLSCVKALIEAGANLNRQDKTGFTALMWSAQQSHVECLTLLINAGADLKIQTKEKLTALMLAAKKGHVECLKVIIQNMDDLDAVCATGFTALMYAALNGHLECLRVLIESGANVNLQTKIGFTALIIVANQNNLECLRALIESGADVNLQGEQGLNALMLATYENNVECLRALIESGANLNLKDESGLTALMFAAKRGNLNSLKALIESGANVNLVTEEGATALMYAALNKNVKCLRVLLDIGAEPHLQNVDGCNALMLASQEGSTDCVEALLQSSVNLNMRCKDGLTALIIAVKNGQVDCVNLLIEARVPLNEQCDLGLTALMFAAFANHIDCLKALIKAGADLNLSGKYGCTALTLATDQDNVECLRVLIENGVSLDWQDEDGETALMLAAYDKRVECLKILIRAGANLNLKNKSGETALMLAAKVASRKCIKALLKANADTSILNNRGLSASTILENAGHGDMLKFVANLHLKQEEPLEPTARISKYDLGNCSEISAAKLLRLSGITESIYGSMRKKSLPTVSSSLSLLERDPPFPARAAAAAPETDEDALDEVEQELKDAILKAKDYDQVITILKKKKFVEDRNSGHKILKAPTGGIVAIPMHSKDKPPIGTLRAIAMQAIQALR